MRSVARRQRWTREAAFPRFSSLLAASPSLLHCTNATPASSTPQVSNCTRHPAHIARASSRAIARHQRVLRDERHKLAASTLSSPPSARSIYLALAIALNARKRDPHEWPPCSLRRAARLFAGSASSARAARAWQIRRLARRLRPLLSTTACSSHLHHLNPPAALAHASDACAVRLNLKRRLNRYP